MIVGVDGCKKNWICVFKNLETNKIEAHLLTLEQLFSWDPLPTIVAIDIPIGLTDSEPRQVDILARQKLGQPRMSSVFSAPVRACLEADTYPKACESSATKSGHKLSLQTWGICKKIAEVDNMLRKQPSLHDITFEIHPEVSFWAWNSNRAMEFRKKSSDGKKDRRSLIQRHFGQAVYDEIRGRFLKKEVPDDDLHDAFAALWTAERIGSGHALKVCPETERDSIGLPMQIWY
jgi:predicted RNase H-like nuclease